MAYILGIDTGGTYTDTVVYDNESGKILSKAKALTTRENLATGIENCLELLDRSCFPQLDQVNLSTTLATNAIVEGRGNKIALFLLGDRPKGALPAEYLIDISGKYDIRGRQICPLDVVQTAEAAQQIKDKVSAVAVSGFCSIRNSSHELQAKKIIQQYSKLPVICAHEMSSRLGYYDRTVTTALNARLLSVIYDLLKAVRGVLEKYSPGIPLMIVTGSGSLVSEQVALERPIETVLSGPAASIAGAMYIAGKKDGLILDMGGTTTDIALAEEGNVKMSVQGADVGGYHLHIEAAEIFTFGIGGDSRISIGQENCLGIGPNKVYPVCRAAMEFPELMAEMRQVQPAACMQRDRRNLLDGFMLYLKENCSELNFVQERVLEYLKDGPHTLYKIKAYIGDLFKMEDLHALEEKGIIMRIAFTPTDVLHAEGSLTIWDRPAALFMASDMAGICSMKTEDFICRCKNAVEDRLVRCCKNSKNKKKLSVIGVGAPCKAWLPEMAKRLDQNLCLPQHHEVANAIGAAVASVSESAEALIRYNSITGTYIVFLPDIRMEFEKMETARKRAVRYLTEYVSQMAWKAGCEDPDISIREEETKSQDTFVEYEITARAVGQSRWLK